MNAQQKTAANRGWVEAAPGYWARGTWRVQRGYSGWTWWNAIGSGLPFYNAGKKGRAPHMLAAMDAAEALDTPEKP